MRDRVARGASAEDVQRALDDASAQLSGVSLKAGASGEGVTVEASLETEIAGKNIRFSFELSG